MHRLPVALCRCRTFRTIRQHGDVYAPAEFGIGGDVCLRSRGLWRSTSSSTGGRGAKRVSGFEELVDEASEFENDGMARLLCVCLEARDWDGRSMAFCGEPWEYLLSVQFNEWCPGNCEGSACRQPGWFVLFFVLRIGFLTFAVVESSQGQHR